MDHYRPKQEDLGLLFSISQLLDQSIDIKQVLNPVLETLAEHLGENRGAITLLDRRSGDITTEAAHGLTEEERNKGRYQLGEGVTGKVIQTGKPMIIERIGSNPDFLNRTGSRKGPQDIELSFICVPVKNGAETIGALSIDVAASPRDVLEEKARLLSVISSMIAQAVRVRQQILEEKRLLLEENRRLKNELQEKYRPQNIIGNSKAMQAVFDQIIQVSRSDAPVLIRGENGSGKELVASAIHYNSPRADRPFVKVNCASLPESVLETELFGYEKGAFAGALSQRRGKIEMANGGTLFLDEIADLAPMTQIKLLRLLQEKEFERLGSTEVVSVNVRVIVASNRQIEDLVYRQHFREDLYYRLNVLSIRVPPLRDRKSDILLLADHFVQKYAELNMKSVRRISTPAIDLLTNYHWPGNVRELENCIERAVLLSVDEVIHSHQLPPSLQSAESSGTRISETLEEALDKHERELLGEALKSSKGNMTKAARMLGLTERKMGLRVKKYDIDPRQFR